MIDHQSTRQPVTSDLDRLRAQLTELVDTCPADALVDELVEIVTDLAAENRVLRAALAKHGHHDLGCRVRSWLVTMPTGWSTVGVCDCGLSPLLENDQPGSAS